MGRGLAGTAVIPVEQHDYLDNELFAKFCKYVYDQAKITLGANKM